MANKKTRSTGGGIRVNPYAGNSPKAVSATSKTSGPNIKPQVIKSGKDLRTK